MENNAVNVTNEVLYFVGQGTERVLLQHVVHTECAMHRFLPYIWCNVSAVNILNHLKFSVKFDYQNVGEELTLTHKVTEKC